VTQQVTRHVARHAPMGTKFPTNGSILRPVIFRNRPLRIAARRASARATLKFPIYPRVALTWQVCLPLAMVINLLRIVCINFFPILECVCA
jgi:hypothetical protein